MDELDSNGTLNLGAGTRRIEGAYNVDPNPTISGVYTGSSENLSNIKNGSQSKIIIENPFGYDPFSSEVLRVLSSNGEIVVTGSRSNMNKLVKTLDVKSQEHLLGSGKYVAETANVFVAKFPGRVGWNRKR